MRHGKIGWYAAIILAATASAVGVQAAAPPVECCPEPAPCSLAHDVADGVGQDAEENPCAGRLVEQWKKLAAQQKHAKQTLAASFREETGATNFSEQAPRTFTIVFRIHEGMKGRARMVPGTGYLSPGVAVQPTHAVAASDSDVEINAVVEILQRKLLELHEEGSFEVVVDAQSNDRADVSIHYEPVPPPPPPPNANQPFNFIIGFAR